MEIELIDIGLIAIIIVNIIFIAKMTLLNAQQEESKERLFRILTEEQTPVFSYNKSYDE